MSLDSYLARIGHRVDSAPSTAALNGLLLAHMRAIPFENIDVITRGRVSLDRDDLYAKLVDGRRGGYCYEHGLLLADVLGQLGYDVELLGARVRLRSAPGDPPTARTHLALRVALEGQHYLVDPGFGGPGPQFALPLTQGSDQTGPGGTFRFVAADMDQWSLQRRTGEQFADIYHLGLSPLALIDVEVANHYTSTHPASPFTQMLWVRSIETDGSQSLVNRELASNQSGQRQVDLVTSRDQLVAVLRCQFGLDAPELATASVPGYD